MQPQPLAVDILSIQSQVIYGRVGNNAVIPTLEQHGLTAISIPTVLFSNAPHYPSFYGGVIPDDWFAGYLQAVEDRAILPRTRAIMLGYLGSPAQADILAAWLAKIREQHPHLAIQIDPVLGDSHCGLYVDAGLAESYRNHLRHLATGMTPNHFELEYLAGRPLETLDDVITAARELLSATTRWIIVTSAAPQEWPQGKMRLAVVTAETTDIQEHPHYHTVAHGTGDTFAAGLMAQQLAGKSLSDAARLAAQRVVDVIRRSNAAGYNELDLINKTSQK
ncbi:MAG: pyridoxine/pyridoxal/pyridoxamine kinase [Cardiobacteriaceae bacterium]|nr:pyridoxine/pyridoxal/pyridoxamine kinase [Cardiobacteriaceae bacterium]